MKQTKPVKAPEHPTWALLQPGDYPPGEFSKSLGTIIPHAFLYRPTAECVPSDPEVLAAAFKHAKFAQRFTTEDSNAKVSVDKIKDVKAQAQLMQLLSGEAHDSRSGTLTLNTKSVITRTVKQASDLFAALMDDKATKIKIMEMLKDGGGVADMIVGVKTCVDAKLNFHLHHDRGGSATLKIPIEEIMAALGIPPIAIPFADGISEEGKLQAIKDYLAKHRADGERVFAVQYRRIMTVGRWWSIKDAEMGNYENFQEGIYKGDGDDEDDHDDEDNDAMGEGELRLCPPGEFPEGMVTFIEP